MINEEQYVKEIMANANEINIHFLQNRVFLETLKLIEGELYQSFVNGTEEEANAARLEQKALIRIMNKLTEHVNKYQTYLQTVKHAQTIAEYDV